MAASKQASKHAHARAQCSPASVGLAQARPNQITHDPHTTVDNPWLGPAVNHEVLRGYMYMYM